MGDLLPALGRMGVFLARIIGAIRPSRMFFADTLHQLHVIGSRSVSIVAVGGAFVGLVLALQGYRTLTTFGASSSLGTLLGLTLYRELGPVLAAILFCGRAGSAMAAELGLMRATDQITALSMMAIDPVGKVVAPRFLAGVLSMPLLTMVFCAFAILGGYLQAVHVLGLDAGFFWGSLQDSIDLQQDFGQALVKSVAFGLVTSLIATLVGYHTPPTIEGTSRATTQAVVQGSLMVLCLDFLISALFY